MTKRNLGRVVASILLGFLGPGCCAAVPVSADLGSVDLASPGAALQGSFRAGGRCNSLELRLRNDDGAARDVCSSPDWPLELEVVLLDGSGGGEVWKAVFTSADLRFTNWSLPNTSVVCVPRRRFDDVLVPQRQYLIGIRVIRPLVDAARADVVWHWVDGIR